jgi:pyridoxine kinase
MPMALILSSYVAANRIGGSAQQYALAGLGFDPVLVPTVMFGASPARGGRGRAVDAELFRMLLEGVRGQGLYGATDLVVTGHFSLPEQVELACEAIAEIRGAARSGGGPAPIVLVDPILGDHPKGLYVKPEVAAKVAERLVPLADWITPNLFELSHLAGRAVTALADAAAAARALGKPALATSAPAGEGEIGALLCTAAETVLFAHPRLDQAPNGTGDLVAAMFGAGLAQGLPAAAAAERAIGAVAEALEAARAANATDLPIVSLGERLARPAARLRIERLA